MKTIRFALVSLILAIIATGCRKPHTIPCEPSPPTVSTCAHTDSPPPESRWCPTGEGVILRYALDGDAYFWHPSATCKRKFHSDGEDPYAWVDSDVGCRPGVTLALSPEGACYVRGNTNEAMEIVYAKHTIPSKYLKGTGWRECSELENFEELSSSPVCP
jgi:hypothetical protein